MAGRPKQMALLTLFTGPDAVARGLHMRAACDRTGERLFVYWSWSNKSRERLTQN